MQTPRRRFIKSALGCSLGMSLSPTLLEAANAAKAIPIGFQLYTVRGEFSRNAPETLKTLGQLGYHGVEFWAYGGTPNVLQEYSASELRRLLDAAGLKCCGMHLELKAPSNDRPQRTNENNHPLANE